MYAIVDIAGVQYKVEANQELEVPLLDAEVGKKVEFDRILMVADQDKVNFGMPTLKGKIQATVLAHGKGEKIRIVKKKRRKGYRLNRGHRQQFTTIKVESIKV